MAQLREALNYGDLISAESTIEGLTEEDLESVALPPGGSGDGEDEGGNNPFTEGGGGEIDDSKNTTSSSEMVVNLPAGPLKFKPGNNGQNSLRKRALLLSSNHQEVNDSTTPHHRNLAVYTGTKKVLFVKVTDKNGLEHPDNARTMSDKIFGTYGDTTTVKDQFEACSFGDMKVTNNYGINLGNAESAPGVIEVRLGISLKSSSRSQIQK